MELAPVHIEELAVDNLSGLVFYLKSNGAIFVYFSLQTQRRPVENDLVGDNFSSGADPSCYAAILICVYIELANLDTTFQIFLHLEYCLTIIGTGPPQIVLVGDLLKLFKGEWPDPIE